MLSAPSAGRFEAWSDRLYARAGWWAVPAILTVGGLVAMLTVAGAGAVILLGYVDPPVRVGVKFLGATDAAFLVLMLIGFAISWRLFLGRIVAWLRTRSEDEDMSWVWHSGVNAPVRVVGMVVAMAFPVMLVGIPLAAQREFGLGAQEVAVVVEFVMMTIAFIWAMVVLVGEILVRPLLKVIAAELPLGWAPARTKVSVRVKTVAALVAAVGLSTILTAALMRPQATLSGRAHEALLVTNAIIAIMVAPYIAIITGNILAPLRSLEAAARRVESGDFTARVPVMTRDEFGQVAHRFNAMVVSTEAMITSLSQKDDDLRASRARIVAVADDERRRMERDLHDGAQQYLSLLRLQIATLRRKVGDNPEIAEPLAGIGSTVDEALAELRNLAHGIYPATLETEGVAAALEDAARRSAIPTVVEAHDVPRLERTAEAAVYFCVLEALQNAAKHAGPDAHARISLGSANGRLLFEVADNGAGFVMNGNGSGFVNMRDRLGAVGGDVAVDSTPGVGTTVSGWAPAP